MCVIVPGLVMRNIIQLRIGISFILDWGTLKHHAILLGEEGHQKIKVDHGVQTQGAQKGIRIS